MSNIFITYPPQNDNAAFAGQNGDGSHLSWFSEIDEANLAYSIDGGVFSTASDMPFILDYTTSTFFDAPSVGQYQVIVTNGNLFESNHISLGGVNFETADVRNIEVTTDFGDGNGDTVVASLDTSSRKSFYNDKPLMLLFDAIYNIVTFKVKFTTGVLQSKGVRIATLYSSKTMEFPNQPAIGFKKGKWNTSDKARVSRRQNNAFGRSTVKRMGTEEVVTINAIPEIFMDEEWTELIAKFLYVPVFFSWDLLKAPLDTMYGDFTFEDAVYTQSLYSEIKFKIQGVA